MRGNKTELEAGNQILPLLGFGNWENLDADTEAVVKGETTGDLLIIAGGSPDGEARLADGQVA